jgi:hypothetical protein
MNASHPLIMTSPGLRHRHGLRIPVNHQQLRRGAKALKQSVRMTTSPEGGIDEHPTGGHPLIGYQCLNRFFKQDGAMARFSHDLKRKRLKRLGNPS